MANFSFVEGLKRKLHLKSELPSPEEFVSVRERYVQKRSSEILHELQNHKDQDVQTQFQDLTDDEKQRVSVLIANLELGINLTHREIGMSIKKSDLVVEPHDYYDAGPLTYVSEDAGEVLNDVKDKFLLLIDKFIEIIKNPTKLEKIKKHWDIDEITAEDLFFLVGVEEAAHRAYFNKKNRRDLLTSEDAPTYHTSDHEYRALLWKLKFVKKYFPQYIDKFERFLHKNTEIRSSAIITPNRQRNL